MQLLKLIIHKSEQKGTVSIGLDNIGKRKRCLVITDGIFSMRGDNAPLDVICNLARKYDHHYEEGIVTVVDDSPGVGALRCEEKFRPTAILLI